MDIVEYTKLKMRDQLGVKQQLTDIVRNTNEYRRKKGDGSVICRPVGDGIAVVFLADPSAPARCAIEITRNVRRQTSISLRMGMHSGPVYRDTDINEQPDVSGAGINTAQRVMDGGDANHILLSRAMGDILVAIGDWTEYVSEIGQIEGKHGVRFFVYNFAGPGFGNPNPPSKRVLETGTKPLVKSAGLSSLSPQSTDNTKKTVLRPGKASDRARTLRHCDKCGMLLLRDSRSCIHCGATNRD